MHLNTKHTHNIMYKHLIPQPRVITYQHTYLKRTMVILKGQAPISSFLTL